MSVFCAAWVFKNVLLPGWAYLWFADDYRTLASECGNAMDESWFLDQESEPGMTISTSVHLMVCHDYDLTRKTMLSLGLSENVLSYLGLQGLELGQHSAEEFVKQHRFVER